MIRAIFVVGSAAIAPQSEVIRAVFVLKRQQERKERHQSLAEWHGSRSARKDSVSHPAAGHPAGVEDRRFPRGPPRVELVLAPEAIRATHQEGSLYFLHGLRPYVDRSFIRSTCKMAASHIQTAAWHRRMPESNGRCLQHTHTHAHALHTRTQCVMRAHKDTSAF